MFIHLYLLYMHLCFLCFLENYLEWLKSHEALPDHCHEPFPLLTDGLPVYAVGPHTWV